MPTRKETNLRRQALHEELRLACRNGTLPLGEPLPPVRELAGRYAVSHRVVSDAIRALTEEGLLYTVPRVGTFVGSADGGREALFIFLRREGAFNGDPLHRLQFGFEEQISRLGGNCLSLDPPTIAKMAEVSGPLVASGVFYMDTGADSANLRVFAPGFHQVRYCEGLEVDEENLVPMEATDHVLFDNRGGGRQVTQYLMRQGHRRIAYMGLHAEGEPRGPFAWSRLRCAGWQESLTGAGQSPDRLEFLPSAMSGYLSIQEQLEASAVVAERLVPALRRDEISAVVTVNPHAAQALFSVLQEAKILADRWPVITTFGMGDARVAMMTSMLLSYEQLGREAADLLWSRAHGGYDGPSRGVAVPMRLITRLTCRPAWMARPEAAVLSAMGGNFA